MLLGLLLTNVHITGGAPHCNGFTRPSLHRSIARSVTRVHERHLAHDLRSTVCNDENQREI